MAHDTFISYSNKDKSIADAICANLESAGVRCWIAPRDIAPGEDWPEAISKAISTSRVMVLVFSANSNSSDDVGRELILAANNKLIIIPFKIDNITPVPGKEFFLARTHWLDAMNPPKQKQIDKLVGYVSTFLSEPGEPFPPTDLREVEPGKPHKGIKGKSIWILGLLLILAIAGGSLYALHPFAPSATPTRTQAPTSTPTFPPPPTQTPTATPLPVPSGKVVISAIISNGSGSQEADEYVEISNEDTRAIQLQGWTLQDSAGHVYTFPSFVMQPGQACRVYTNQSHPETCGFTYGSGSAIWANTGDCASLKDSLSVVINERCYK